MLACPVQGRAQGVLERAWAVSGGLDLSRQGEASAGWTPIPQVRARCPSRKVQSGFAVQDSGVWGWVGHPHTPRGITRPSARPTV